MTEKLDKLVRESKAQIVRFLSSRIEALSRQLESYVVYAINWRVKRNWSMVHETKPLHTLAFILAFEELEREKQISIDRHGLPVCMIDNETVFKLTVKEGL